MRHKPSRIVPNAHQCRACCADCACVGQAYLPDTPMRAKCPKFKRRPEPPVDEVGSDWYYELATRRLA